MDWRKAVGILVVSFLVLNVMLAVNLYIKAIPPRAFTLKESEQQKIKTFLESRGIILKAQIPPQGVPVSFLEIGYQPVQEESVIRQFFGGKAPRVEEINGGKKFLLGERQLVVMENGTVTYIDKGSEQTFGSLDEGKALKAAEDFLKTHGGFPKDARLNAITYDPKSGGYLIEYVRYYKGFFIANSYIDLLVTPCGVTNFYMSWLKPLGFRGKKREVIPPITAILRVDAERKSGEPVVIKKVEQGFYSQFYNADRWQAAPVWKVELENGEIYYVNAYTGELER
ncbi:two-component system regulatory protein YycI [Thermosediminibacter litoriperuensis]|uniref:Regulatory protein YycI of two-component signal transduction system YycFG n=1 Tax=Thermosediminibacter litoriperuensis TaxID=291989 RepID=A0A5S5AW93_9FIRM|nr:two-component system regulatory protein YycI [Thermosediminibacter litoriperuensis]TYP57453.1 regulatory protein YycI of two-component signal transduction system YycFG [Thermosediminibacter litoriperuensis]